MNKKNNTNNIFQKAFENHQKGNLQKAKKLYMEVLSKDQNHPDANHNLGVLLIQDNKVDEAIPFFELAFKLDPSNIQYKNNLNNAIELKQENNIKINSYNLDKELVELFNQSKYKEAHIKAKEALENDLNNFIALKIIGLIYFKLKDYENALINLNNALKLNKNDLDILNTMASIYKSLNRIEETEQLFRKILDLNPDVAQHNFKLAVLLNSIGKQSEAEQYYKKALILNPKSAIYHSNLGLLVKNAGRLKEAEQYFRKAIQLNPDDAKYHRVLSSQIKYTPNEPHLKQLIDIYNDKSTNPNKYQIIFALAKAYEDIEDYETSFKYFHEANKLKFDSLNYNVNNDIQLFNRIQSIFLNRGLKNGNIPKINSDKRPIFIVGMPRSGTTLVEQIISSHTEVHGCGELEFLRLGVSNHIIRVNNSSELDIALPKLYNEYLSKIEKLNFSNKIFTDKMPHNFRYIGAILEAFPNAKIINLKREPMAICWSLYKNHFSNTGLGYSYNLDTIAIHFQKYEEMMRYWHEKYPGKIYDLEYEKLTNNQYDETVKLLDYCELDFEESVLNPHQNTKSVSTASSLQIRKKIYKGSSEAWKRYEKYLEPLKQKLSVY